MSSPSYRSERCPGCNATYKVDIAKIPHGGGWLTCPTCAGRWFVRPRLPELSEPSSAPLTPRAAGPATPATTTRIICPQCQHQFDAVTPTRPGRKSVLIVDDQEFFRNFAVDLLSDRYEAHVAKSVAEALRRYDELRPDLLVLDLGLDGGADDGKSILAHVAGQVPVVVMTGRLDFDLYGEDWKELVRLGARELVVKSMSIDEELRAKVTKLIGA